MLTTYGFVSPNPKCQETTLSVSIDEKDPYFAQKEEILKARGMVAVEQLFDIRHDTDPMGPLINYFRIREISNEADLTKVQTNYGEMLSEGNEARAKIFMRRIIQDRKDFIDDARARLKEAYMAGQESLVRKEVADIITASKFTTASRS